MALKPYQTLHIINMDIVTDIAIYTNITMVMAMVTVQISHPKLLLGYAVFDK